MYIRYSGNKSIIHDLSTSKTWTPAEPVVLIEDQYEVDRLLEHPEFTQEADDSASVSSDDTAWGTIWVPATSVVLGGAAADPGRATADGTLLFDADAAEETFFLVQLPTSYKATTSLKPYLHWGSTTAVPSNETTGAAIWQLSYKVLASGAAVPASFTDLAAQELELTEVADSYELQSLGTIVGTSLEENDVLLCKLARVATDGSDTYDDDAKVFGVDVRFEIEKFGTTVVAPE